MEPINSASSETGLQDIDIKEENAEYDEQDCINLNVDIEEYMPWLQEPCTDWTIEAQQDGKVSFTVITPGETLKKPLLCKCLNCYKLFGDTYSLLQHNLDHLKIPLNRCDGLQPAVKQKRREDYKTKHKHKCEICGKILTYRTWHTHMREVHTAYTFPCDKCNKIFKCPRYFKRHQKFVHEGLPKYKNLTPNQIKCDQCDAVFNHKSPLSTHIRNVHGAPAKCEICNSVMKSQSYLKGHMLRVHFDDGKKHVCLVCGKSFKSPRYVSVHMKNNHKLNGRDVKNNAKLEAAKALMKIKCRKKKPVFKCDYCINDYSDRYSLDNHRRMAHFNENKLMKMEYEEGIENRQVNNGLNYDLVVREIKIEEM